MIKEDTINEVKKNTYFDELIEKRNEIIKSGQLNMTSGSPLDVIYKEIFEELIKGPQSLSEKIDKLIKLKSQPPIHQDYTKTLDSILKTVELKNETDAVKNNFIKCYIGSTSTKSVIKLMKSIEYLNDSYIEDFVRGVRSKNTDLFEKMKKKNVTFSSKAWKTLKKTANEL